MTQRWKRLVDSAGIIFVPEKLGNMEGWGNCYPIVIFNPDRLEDIQSWKIYPPICSLRVSPCWRNRTTTRVRDTATQRCDMRVVLLEIKAQDKALDIFFLSVLFAFIKGCRPSIKNQPLGRNYTRKIKHYEK